MKTISDLINAVQNNNNIDEAKEIVRSGIDVNLTKEECTMTALMWAANAGNIDMMECLLEAGAKINQPSEDGWTALMSAAQAGRTNVAAFLLRNGGVIDQTDDFGNTALAIAISDEEIETAEFLIQSGASVNNVSDLGSIIKCAARSKSSAGITLLVKYGATIPDKLPNRTSEEVQSGLEAGLKARVELELEFKKVHEDSKVPSRSPSPDNTETPLTDKSLKNEGATV